MKMGNRFSLWAVLVALLFSAGGIADKSAPERSNHGTPGTPLNPKRRQLAPQDLSPENLLKKLNEVEFKDGNHQAWWFWAGDLVNKIWEKNVGDVEKFKKEMRDSFEAKLTDDKKKFGLQYLAAARAKEISELMASAKKLDATEPINFEARAARQELLQRFKNPNSILLSELFNRGIEKSAEDAEKLMKLLADSEAFEKEAKAVEAAKIMAKLMGYLGKEQRIAFNSIIATLLAADPKEGKVRVGGVEVPRSELDSQLLRALKEAGAVSVNMTKEPEKEGFEKEFHKAYSKIQKENDEFWDWIARAKTGDGDAKAKLAANYDDADIADYLGGQWKAGNEKAVVEATKALGTVNNGTYSINLTQRGVDAEQPAQNIVLTLGKTDQEITASLAALHAATRKADFEQGRTDNELPVAFLPSGFSAVSFSRSPQFPTDSAKKWVAYQPSGNKGSFAPANTADRVARPPVDPKNANNFTLPEVKPANDSAKPAEGRKLTDALEKDQIRATTDGAQKFLTASHTGGNCVSCHDAKGTAFKFEVVPSPNLKDVKVKYTTKGGEAVNAPLAEVLKRAFNNTGMAPVLGRGGEAKPAIEAWIDALK